MNHRHIQVLTILRVRSVRLWPRLRDGDNDWMVAALEELMREGLVTKRTVNNVTSYGLSPRGLKSMRVK